MTRIATLAAAVLLTAGVLAQGAKPITPAQAQASLQGTWVVKSFNGQPAGEGDQEVTLIVTGDKYAQSVGGTVNERGTVKIDPSKTPMTIDLNILEGDDTGKLQLGVIEITGDTLTCKLNTPGVATRPANLALEEGFFVVVAARRK
ncbi:MAG TPA: TIGR03067 domain-containing protein [Vicinamibacterales bacterium]|nr:TIGR03067 domain-containing protein [Vicinamibacterales bacterium]